MHSNVIMFRKMQILLYCTFNYVGRTHCLQEVGSSATHNLIHICRIHQCNRIILMTEYGSIASFMTWHFHPQCLGETWYLSVDMQLYLFTPLVLLPLIKKPKIGIILLEVVIAASILTSFLQLHLDNQTVSV